MEPIYKKYLMTAALIWVGCFVFFLFVYMLVLAPQQKGKRRIEQQLIETKQIYSSTQKAAQKETQDELNKQLQHLQSKLKKFVVDSEDLTNLTFDISRIASEKKVDSFSIKVIDNLAGRGVSENTYLDESNIDISFAAGFNEFAALLSALERHQPVIFVDKFQITRATRENAKHRVSMDLAVFVRKQQEDG